MISDDVLECLTQVFFELLFFNKKKYAFGKVNKSLGRRQRHIIVKKLIVPPENPLST